MTDSSPIPAGSEPTGSLVQPIVLLIDKDDPAPEADGIGPGQKEARRVAGKPLHLVVGQELGADRGELPDAADRPG
ncbi:hypothetical protein [Arthrobacter sp. CP30]